jgi:hypothetical protein
MKVCTRCKIEKGEDDFHRSSHFKDGRQRYCKACRKILDAEIYAKGGEEYKRRKLLRQQAAAQTNAELIFEYLLQHPCVDCGESDPLVLEFDHVRGEKKHNLSDLIQKYGRWETIKAEIDKCDARCANCHRRITAKRIGNKRYKLWLEST